MTTDTARYWQAIETGPNPLSLQRSELRSLLETIDSLRAERDVLLVGQVETLHKLRAAEARAVQWFPILGTGLHMRRDLLDEHQARRNHSQTLDRLAERGGLCPVEAMAIIKRTAFQREKMVDAFKFLIEAHNGLTQRDREG